MTGRDNTVRPLRSCEGFEVQLAPYCASELDPQEIEELEIHLASCSECAAELQRERHLRATMGEMPVVPCPDRVTEATLAEIEGERTPQPELGRRWTTWTGLVAAVLALALLASSPWQNAGGPDQAETYTAQEIAQARADARASLILTAAILNMTEKSTVKEVFGLTLPKTLNRSIKTLMTTPEGGQG
jgi:anti-sigma factor RsiW